MRATLIFCRENARAVAVNFDMRRALMSTRWGPVRIVQIFVLVAALTLGVTPVLATNPATVFELDGNAADNPAGAPDDWQTVNAGPANSIARTGVLVDPAGTTIFSTGGSKDINDVSQWRWTSGSVPDKDEIVNAYAAAYSIGGRLIIVAGADRFANNGSANVGFWFFQQNVGPQADGTFGPGVHSVGDILVVVEFTGGGVIQTARVFRWTGTNLALVVQSTACGAQGQNPSVCARSNTANAQLFWTYEAKQPPADANVAPPGSFVEMGIDITSFFPAGQVPCFSSFLAETRSSAEANAQLKDFVAGQFNLCRINIAKSCTAGDTNATDTGFVWTFSGNVSNGGFGTLFNTRVVDAGPNQVIDTPVGESLAGDDIVFPIGTLTAGQSQSFGGTFETIGTTPNPASNIARAEAAITAGGPLIVTALSQLTQCPPVTKSPDLAVSKCCQPRLAVVNNTVRIAIDVAGTVCNVGTVTLTNVSVVNDNGTPANTGDDAILLNGVTLADTDDPNTPDDDRCASYSGSYFPSGVNAGSSTTDPDGAAFQDTVRANGISTLFGAATEETASATCALCAQPNCPANP